MPDRKSINAKDDWTRTLNKRAQIQEADRARGYAANAVRRRRIIQWVLAPIVVIVIGLGWRFPILGYVVPAVMFGGAALGLFRGRYVCGNLCPRGAFLDRAISKISLMRPIPRFLRSKGLRVFILIALMGFMVFRIMQNPTDWRYLGRVFWLMCVITTGIGVALGAAINPRSWCSFCPVGTLQNALGGGKYRLGIDAALCRECGKCESVCPMGLKVYEGKDEGVVADRDCLKCLECVAACPTKAIARPRG